MTIKKSHNFPFVLMIVVALGLAQGVFGSGGYDAATIRYIKEHLDKPGHTWSGYQGVARGLASTNREVRFFAVQAGLQLDVFRSEALGMALKDTDPGILNLGLAALEREYRTQYSPRLVEIVLSGHVAGLPALRLLLRHDLPHVALSFETLFQRGGRAVRESLLEELRKGRIVMSAPAILALSDLMGTRERVMVLACLAQRGEAAFFAGEYGRWSADVRRKFIQALRDDAQMAAEPALALLLGHCRDSGEEEALRSALLAAGNQGLRQVVARELLEARDMAAARALADALVVLGGKEDQALEYARAVIMIDRYAMGERILAGWAGQRLKGLSELATSLRNPGTMGAVRTIGRLQEDARALQRITREQAEMRAKVRSYLQSPASVHLKRNLAAFLASAKLSF